MQPIIPLLAILSIVSGQDQLLRMPGGFLVDPNSVEIIPNGSIISWNSTVSTITTTYPDSTVKLEVLNKNFQLENSVSKRDYGWVSSGWQSGYNFTDFSAQWTVPQPPSNQGDNQTIFFFNSWTKDAILQPVLQWGTSAAGGEHNHWNFASYWVLGDFQPKFKVSPLVRVHPGDLLRGEITYSKTQQSMISIRCYVNNKLTGDLLVNSNGPYNSAQVASEVYGVMNCQDYPPNGPLTFERMKLKDSNKVVTKAWGIQEGNHVECGKIVCPNFYTCSISF